MRSLAVWTAHFGKITTRDRTICNERSRLVAFGNRICLRTTSGDGVQKRTRLGIDGYWTTDWADDWAYLVGWSRWR